MFDPRVRLHSREQAIIMATIRFPPDVKSQEDKAFEQATQEMALRDEYYLGELGSVAPPDHEAIERFEEQAQWDRFLADL